MDASRPAARSRIQPACAEHRSPDQRGVGEGSGATVAAARIAGPRSIADYASDDVVVAGAPWFRQVRQSGGHPGGGARLGRHIRDAACRGESKAVNLALRGVYTVTALLLLGIPDVVAGADWPTSTARVERDADWTHGLSLHPEYSEGRYGTRHTTQILYAPLISEWSPTDRLDLRLTIPYLWERGRDILAIVGVATVRDAQRVRVRRTPSTT